MQQKKFRMTKNKSPPLLSPLNPSWVWRNPNGWRWFWDFGEPVSLRQFSSFPWPSFCHWENFLGNHIWPWKTQRSQNGSQRGGSRNRQLWNWGFWNNYKQDRLSLKIAQSSSLERKLCSHSGWKNCLGKGACVVGLSVVSDWTQDVTVQHIQPIHLELNWPRILIFLDYCIGLVRTNNIGPK